MPVHHYEASDPEGSISLGVIEADSPRHARSLLRQRGLTPIEVTCVQKKNSRGGWFSAKLSVSELSLATRQISSLLLANLTVVQALGIVIDQAEKSIVRDRLAAIRSEVVAGQTLSDALSLYPRDFPEIYRALVLAGEQSGDLAKVMLRLADYMESQGALTQKILLAFIYPIVVTIVSFLVIIVLLTYVVPQIINVFEQTQQTLPFLTIALIALSNFFRKFGFVAMIFVGTLFFVTRRLLKIPAFRFFYHNRLLTLPIIGRLAQGLDAARFASTLGILVGSGVPLVRSLEAGTRTLANDVLRQEAKESLIRVKEGSSLSLALKQGNKFPPVMIHLIASGETTGNLAEMLDRAASILSKDTERRTMILTGLLEPLLILGMGLIVLLIVLSVMLPIIEINQLVS